MAVTTKSNKLSYLAEKLLKKGINNEGIEALKRSMRLSDESDKQSYLDIASSLFESGDYEHTKIFLKTFLEYWMASEAYFLFGEIAKKEKRYKDAFEHYRKGLSIYSSRNLNPYYEFLSLCNILKEEDKGLDIAKSILKVDNRDKIALTYMAKYFYKNKLYKEAISFYEILVENNIADYNDYHYYGVCLHEIKDYKKAENMYIKALDMYPSKNQEIINLKELRERKIEDNYPNIEEAKEKYLKNIEENPTHIDYFHLGNIEFIKRNYEKATELYNKAKELYEINKEKNKN